MTSIQHQAGEIVNQYVHLTGREARVQIYEHSLYDFIRAGFTCDEFVIVVKFLVSENRRNKFQYSLKLGNLIQNHDRFMDLLGEAKAKARNTPAKPTEKSKTLAAWRGCEPVSAGRIHHISDFLKQPNT